MIPPYSYFMKHMDWEILHQESFLPSISQREQGRSGKIQDRLGHQWSNPRREVGTNPFPHVRQPLLPMCYKQEDRRKDPQLGWWGRGRIWGGKLGWGQRKGGMSILYTKESPPPFFLVLAMPYHTFLPIRCCSLLQRTFRVANTLKCWSTYSF